MSRGLWPSGAQCVVIYDVWRLLGGPDSGNLIDRVGPLKEPWSSEVGDPGVRGLETLEARSDECLEDCGPRELNVSYSTMSGGSWERHIPGTCGPGWVRLKNLGLRGLELPEARSVESSCGVRDLELVSSERDLELVFSEYKVSTRSK